MTRRRLVVSADDFGAAPEVNAAVERAHRCGVLTNASLMVTGEAAAEAVEVARRLPRLGVGLHLVLVQGAAAAPAARIPRLVGRDGRFGDAPLAGGLRYAWLSLGRRGAAELRAEIEAQLVAFAHTGLALSHVDGHMNLHLHPAVLSILIALAPRYGIRALRLPREPLVRALRWDGRHVMRRSIEAATFAALARWAMPRLNAAGITTPLRVYGMHHTGEIDAAYLGALLGDLPAGDSEVYCHPAVAIPSAGTGYRLGPHGVEELAALVHPDVSEAARMHGIELVNYNALAGGPPQVPTGSSR
jgi:hopanoid biosynthesis associated protein HpnK